MLSFFIGFLLLNLFPNAEATLIQSGSTLSSGRAFTGQITINGNQVLVAGGNKQSSQWVNLITLKPDDPFALDCGYDWGDGVCSVVPWVKLGDYRGNSGFWAAPDGVWVVGGRKDYISAANMQIDIIGRNVTTGALLNASFTEMNSLYLWGDTGLWGCVV
jgi:hypothetical protein